MDFQAELKDILDQMRAIRTPWTFDGSAGGNASIGTPWLRVGANAMGGMLRLKNGKSAPTTFTFGGLGGSYGLSLVPVPFNFSFSLPSFPTGGAVYKLPFAGKTLSERELRGALVMLEISGDVGPGCSGAIMFMGGSLLYASMLSLGIAPLLLPALLATSNAGVRLAGLTSTLVPYNAAVACYLGVIE